MKRKNNFVIRKMEAGDYPSCTALCGGKCNFSETCLAQRAAGNRTAYALYLKGKIIAECHLVFDNPAYGTVPGRRVYFSRMFTKKAFRCQGYGMKMAQFILSLAKEQGYEEIALGVNCDNDTAVRLYQKLGFSVYDTNLK